MTNPKIIKVNAAISKTLEQIAFYQQKLKDLEKQKINLENEEVIAMFRREKLNEDEFAALLNSRRNKAATSFEGNANYKGVDEIETSNNI